jgi:ABC-type nitrate/sulfonate/bicarbonate transport system ATPase subunit
MATTSVRDQSGGSILCRDVSHIFSKAGSPDVQVLDGVNLTIEKQSFVSLLGPSGCGKTTLLRIIDGLIPATSGEVLIDGEVVKKPEANRAMVFQEHNLLPWKTALENVEFGCRLATRLPRAERRSRALAALGMAGLADFANHYPSQLSGGMKQRVGIARALAIDPTTMLMDEPFGALDAQTRELMQNELLRLWEADRKTVVFVTHSIDEAVLLSDLIVVMSHRPGRIKALINVSLPRPRTETLRATAEWNDLRQHLWELLRPEIDETARAG